MRCPTACFLFLISFLMVSCGEAGKGNAMSQAAKIEQLFPMFASYQLVAFRNEDWCKALEYRRGRYASSSGGACIGILSGNRRPFDKTARRDQAAINSFIREAHDPLRVITAVRYSEKGELEYGVFDCREGERGLLYVFSVTPLGDEPFFQGTPLGAIGPNWWAGS